MHHPRHPLFTIGKQCGWRCRSRFKALGLFRLHEWNEDTWAELPPLTLLFWVQGYREHIIPVYVVICSAVLPETSSLKFRSISADMQQPLCKWEAKKFSIPFPVYTNLCRDLSFSHKALRFLRRWVFFTSCRSLRSSVLDGSPTSCSTGRIIICISPKLNLLRGTMWQIKLEAAGIVMRTWLPGLNGLNGFPPAAPGGRPPGNKAELVKGGHRVWGNGALAKQMWKYGCSLKIVKQPKDCFRMFLSLASVLSFFWKWKTSLRLCFVVSYTLHTQGCWSSNTHKHTWAVSRQGRQQITVKLGRIKVHTTNCDTGVWYWHF